MVYFVYIYSDVLHIRHGIFILSQIITYKHILQPTIVFIINYNINYNTKHDIKKLLSTVYLAGTKMIRYLFPVYLM